MATSPPQNSPLPVSLARAQETEAAARPREHPIEARSLGYDIHRAPLIRDVDLVLRQGDFLAMVGPGRAGKTTFVQICLGRLRPMRGSLTVFGRSPAVLGERRGWIGYVPQAPPKDHPPETGVLSFVSQGAAPPSRTRRLDTGLLDRAAEAMRLAGVSDLGSRSIGRLDGLQMRRTRLARALVNHPRLLIVDNLCKGLMEAEWTALVEQIAMARSEWDLTVLILSRDIGPLDELVPELMLFNRKVVFRGPADRITYDLMRRAYHP